MPGGLPKEATPTPTRLPIRELLETRPATLWDFCRKTDCDPPSTMKLFILGPAFGLPSIDAQCIAATALLQLYVPNDYEIIPSHDESRPLPHLVDGTARISGFNSIVRHLADKRIISQGQLDRQQRADAVAITSFIETSAQTLLDISLYVGFENYRLATRPAYSKILPWHANYTLPPRKRNAGRNRTDHLGISSIEWTMCTRI